MKCLYQYLGALNPRVFAIITLCLGLVGCGFHLRDHHYRLNQQFNAIVIPASGSQALYQTLDYALMVRCIERLTCPPENGLLPQLTIVSEQWEQQPLVYGPDGTLRRERMKLTVQFALHFNGERKEWTLYTERERQLNNNQRLGDDAEKILIEKEMRQDIIQQLMRYLSRVN